MKKFSARRRKLLLDQTSKVRPFRRQGRTLTKSRTSLASGPNTSRTFAVFGSLFVVAALAAAFLFSRVSVNAGAADNVFGYAFAQDFGYLSMNCNNTASLDGSGTRTDDCSVPFGTTIASNNKFSGLGWGPNIGWVCFGQTCNGMQLSGGVTLPSNFAAQVSTTAGSKGNLDGESSSGKGGYVLALQDAGLISHWPAEGDALDTTGTNHGKLRGGATFFDGKIGKGFSFFGGSVMEVPDSTTLNFGAADSFTLSAWVKVDDRKFSSGEKSNMVVFSKVGPLGGGYDVRINSSGSVQTGLSNISLTSSGPNSTISNSAQFYHIAAVRDQSKKKLFLYLDGQLVGERNDPTGDLTVRGNLTLGAFIERPGAPTDFRSSFDGIIDEARIYNRALSAADIQILAAQATASPPPTSISGGELALSGTATDGSAFGVFVNTTGASTSNTNGRCKNEDGSDMTVAAGEFCGLGYNSTLGFLRFKGVIAISKDVGQDPPTVIALSPNTATKNPTTTPTFRWATVDPEGDPQAAAELVVCQKDLNANCENDPLLAFTPQSGTTVVGVFASMSSNVAAGATTIPVDTTSGFAALDAVMIHQTQASNASLAGVYEFGNVASVTGTSITLKNPLQKSYTSGGPDHAQIVRVAHYAALTIPSGAVLTSSAWDGTKGGILAVAVHGTLTVQSGGKIDMTGKGFRGGDPSTPGAYGYQGESFSGRGGASPSPNNGGGGGGHPTTGGWTSQNHNDLYWKAGGGGGGGYGSAGSNGGPGGGNGVYGVGGTVYGTAALTSQVHFGSGGGSGGWNSNYGGSGGGIVLIFGNTLTVNGTIESRGDSGVATSGEQAGGSGGGSGGSILAVASTEITSSSLVVAGGDGSGGGGPYSYGGAGGAGRLLVDTSGSIQSLSSVVARGNLSSATATSCTYPCGLSATPTLNPNTFYTWKVRATDTFHALTSQPFSSARDFFVQPP